MPELYQFNDIYIRKPNGKLRPISLEETTLQLLHKILLQELRSKHSLSKHQYALEKKSQLKCLLAATKIYKNKQLLTIDVKNAFNSLPWEVIDNTLSRINFPVNLKAYIMDYVKYRWSERIG